MIARCFEPAVLEKMSSHYETQKPLPSDIIDKIIKRYVLCSIQCRLCQPLTLRPRPNSRYVNVGLYYLRQVFFAKYDIKVHTDRKSVV